MSDFQIPLNTVYEDEAGSPYEQGRFVEIEDGSRSLCYLTERTSGDHADEIVSLTHEEVEEAIHILTSYLANQRSDRTENIDPEQYDEYETDLNAIN